MKHIFLNLRSTIRNQRFFFVLTICAVLISSSLLLFAFGAYQNYNMEKQSFTDQQTKIGFKFYTKDDRGQMTLFNVSKSEVQSIIESINSEIHDEIYIIVSHNVIREYTKWAHEYATEDDIQNPMTIASRFIYHDGVYQPWAGQLDSIINGGGIESGRYYTYDEYADGEKVMISSRGYPIADDQGRLLINGDWFEPIMRVNTVSEIPFTALADDTVVRAISFYFNLPPNAYQVDQLMNAFSSALGDRVVLPEWEPFYTEDYMLYDTMIGIAVLIAVVAALNIIVLYYYILLKRRKFLAITMLCGCTRIKAVLLYLGESLALTVPLFAIASVCYHFLLLPLLSKLFPFIDTAYSFKLYAVAMLIYIAVCTVGMLLVAIRAVYGSSIAQIKTTT